MQHHHTAAEGYLQLGMHQDAWDELEALEPEERARPEVLLLRLHIFHGLKKWDSATAMAESMLSAGIRDPSVFILGAYAIRRARSLREAFAFLSRGEEDLEGDAILHFNLACYHCQLGEIDAAKGRLERALKLAPSMRQTALEDPDLEPLWTTLATRWP